MTYEIYYNDEIVYAPHLVPYGYGLFSPKLTMELNKAGSLKFIMSMKHPMYGKLHKLRGDMVVFRDGEEIFRGRVLSDKRDFYNNKEIVVEGELAFLNDVPVEPYDYPDGILRSKLFQQFVANYCKNVEPNRKIYAGDLHLEDPGEMYYGMNESWPTVISEILDKLTDEEKEKGYVITRRDFDDETTYIDFYDKLDTRVCAQQIEFGVNLLSLEDYIDATDIYTRVIPLGANDDNGMPIDITSVNDGKNYIESEEGVREFGIITVVKTYPNIKKPDDLKKEAEKFLKDGPLLNNTLTVKAADLHDFNDSIDTFKIGYYVNVKSEPHHLDTKMLLTKVVLDLQDPSKNEYTFGRTIKRLTEEQTKISQQSALTVIRSDRAEQGIKDLIVGVDEASKTATNFLSYSPEDGLTVAHNRLNGYVNIHPTNGITVTNENEAKVRLDPNGLHFQGIRNRLELLSIEYPGTENQIFPPENASDDDFELLNPLEADPGKQVKLYKIDVDLSDFAFIYIVFTSSTRGEWWGSDDKTAMAKGVIVPVVHTREDPYVCMEYTWNTSSQRMVQALENRILFGPGRYHVQTHLLGGGIQTIHINTPTSSSWKDDNHYCIPLKIYGFM